LPFFSITSDGSFETVSFRQFNDGIDIMASPNDHQRWWWSNTIGEDKCPAT
jgi:hypothetical protein